MGNSRSSKDAGMNRTQPNVIVFFTDQQRWDTTGVHGNPLNLTPNFDRMALAGTHIAHSFTCQPVCGPARSCLQTGLYATTSGCYRNGIPLPEGTPTLAHHFAEAGYQTAYFGKWHLAGEEPVPEAQRGGYQHWLASNVLEFSSDAYDTVVYNNDNEAVKLPGYRVDALTDAAIRYIDQHQTDPFFMFISFLEPHHQNHRDDYPAPDVYQGKYASQWMPADLASLGGTAHQHLDGYYGMVRRLDDALGRLMDALKSLNMAESTIILFTSDHGSHFKTRNGEYKRSCHESSIRVPTAICGPGFQNGGRITELVSLIDIPPTLLDTAGIKVPREMQGRSVLSLIQGSKAKADWPREVFIQISESQVGRAIRTERWKYSVKAPDKNGWLDSRANVYEEEFLYDLQADPYELTNLVGVESFRQVADRLKERLVARMIESGEAESQIINAPPVDMGQRRVSLQE